MPALPSLSSLCRLAAEYLSVHCQDTPDNRVILISVCTLSGHTLPALPSLSSLCRRAAECGKQTAASSAVLLLLLPLCSQAYSLLPSTVLWICSSGSALVDLPQWICPSGSAPVDLLQWIYPSGSLHFPVSGKLVFPRMHQAHAHALCLSVCLSVCLSLSLSLSLVLSIDPFDTITIVAVFLFGMTIIDVVTVLVTVDSCVVITLLLLLVFVVARYVCLLGGGGGGGVRPSLCLSDWVCCCCCFGVVWLLYCVCLPMRECACALARMCVICLIAFGLFCFPG